MDLFHGKYGSGRLASASGKRSRSLGLRFRIGIVSTGADADAAGTDFAVIQIGLRRNGMNRSSIGRIGEFASRTDAAFVAAAGLAGIAGSISQDGSCFSPGFSLCVGSIGTAFALVSTFTVGFSGRINGSEQSIATAVRGSILESRSCGFTSCSGGGGKVGVVGWVGNDRFAQ